MTGTIREKYKDGNGIIFIEETGRKTERGWMVIVECPFCAKRKEKVWRDAKTMKSCGCRQGRHTKHGCARLGKRIPEYEVWNGARCRCHNPKTKNYKNYGGRGIKVCDRWRYSFKNFIEDMGRRPGKGYSLDRIDNNGNYEPSNCRWATKKEQERNTRRNIMLTYNGKTQCLADLATETGFDKGTLRHRVFVRKMTVEEAIETPIDERYVRRRNCYEK